MLKIPKKEIIFWFSSNRIRKYWFEYTMRYCEKMYWNALWYNKIENWIQLGNLNILFKVDCGEKHAGIGNINQYWVEELFDNDFEEFFKEIIKKEE